MLLTMHLSMTETLNWRTLGGELRATAARMARAKGRRYAQLVGADGRILAVLETR